VLNEFVLTLLIKFVQLNVDFDIAEEGFSEVW